MSVRICVLGSGSSGNCTFVATERTRVLVDAGFSFREIKIRLQKIGEDIERLDAVLITHEHSDHVAGLPTLSRKIRRPIFITRLTESRVDWGEAAKEGKHGDGAQKQHQPPRIEYFQAGQRLAIGDMEIDSFTVPHDAAD